jgi:hypothetical protein
MKGTFWCCDKKIKPNDVYKVTSKAYSLNQDMGNLNGATNDSLEWEEDGIVTSLMNMVNTTKHGGTTRSYVPQPTNQVTIQEAQIIYDNELAINLVNSTPKFLVQIFNSKKLYSKNIVSCPLAIIVNLAYKENQRVRTID